MMMTEYENETLKELLDADAYQGSAQKTYDYFMIKNNPIAHSQFRAALKSASIKKSTGIFDIVVKLSKRDVLKMLKKI